MSLEGSGGQVVGVVTESRADGIVIRGARTSVTGASFVDEQIVMPTKNMPEAEVDYAVACDVPTNSPGVKVIAEMSGLERVPQIRDKITELMIYAETMRALGIAAVTRFEMVEGVAVPNDLIANAGKYHTTSGHHTAIALLQDIAGGGVVTSPSGADLTSPLTGPLVRKYFAGAAGVPAEDRLRMFNLIRALTASDYAGDDAIATLHGGGSMAAQKQAIQRNYDLDRARTYARRAAGLKA